MIHAQRTPETTIRWKINVDVELTDTIRQEPEARLSSAASQLFRQLTKPARPNRVTGTLADPSLSRAELLPEYALLRQQLIVLRRNQ